MADPNSTKSQMAKSGNQNNSCEWVQARMVLCGSKTKQTQQTMDDIKANKTLTTNWKHNHKNRKCPCKFRIASHKLPIKTER